MSRLTELLEQACRVDAQLGADLKAEVDSLTKRRTFGLVFEAHQPENVDLPGRPVRRGDKVRVLSARGTAETRSKELWRVTELTEEDGVRVAQLQVDNTAEAQWRTVAVEDLVVVAEFRDTIYPGLVETGRVDPGGGAYPVSNSYQCGELPCPGDAHLHPPALGGCHLHRPAL